jgi:glutamine cyclotransferase
VRIDVRSGRVLSWISLDNSNDEADQSLDPDLALEIGGIALLPGTTPIPNSDRLLVSRKRSGSIEEVELLEVQPSTRLPY